MPKIQRAILSVTDKTGLVEFAQKLAALRVELVSTGGTAKLLREAGVTVKDISDLTGFPEMLDGRVKTLHPKVHGGILHIRGNASHVAAAKEHGIQPIDMVVVNLYAFEKTASKPGVHFDEVIENIDIGGPSMVRSAAKNFRDVAIVTSPTDYAAIAQEMATSGGALGLATRWRLAQKAFATTAAYDSAIAATLAATSLSDDAKDFQLPQASAPTAGDDFPAVLRFGLNKAMDLRYGENPHQRASMYSDGSGAGVANGKQLQGKELSFNNIVDLQAAWDLAQEFEETACAIIKHTNPSGCSTGKTLVEAYMRAKETDPVSAFGGVIGVNRVIDGAAAEEMAKLFVEAIAAPGYLPEAKEKFAAKKNLRLVEVKPSAQKFAMKQVSGGMLVQDADVR
ncbi:MAG: bifunctional phosphoribosylaminoimidazolecarboxamide formyltransferase/IMP cyclohydrolase, partial [Candidatus Angelobacter sp.]